MDINKIIIPIENPYETLVLAEKVKLFRSQSKTYLSIKDLHDNYRVEVVKNRLKTDIYGYDLHADNENSKYYNSSDPLVKKSLERVNRVANVYDKLLHKHPFDHYLEMERLQDLIINQSVIGSFHVDGIENPFLLKIAALPNVVEAWRYTLNEGYTNASIITTFERLAQTPWTLTKTESSETSYDGGRYQPNRSDFNFVESLKEPLGEKEVIALLDPLYCEIKHRQNNIIELMQAQKKLIPTLKYMSENIENSLAEESEFNKVKKVVGGR